MKTSKHLLVFALIMVVSTIGGLLSLNDDFKVFICIFAAVILLLLVLNLILRRSLKFKGYFLSKYNIVTTKSKKSIAIDIPQELIIAKILEVLEESNFKLIEADRKNTELLFHSKISFWSWGENLYINLSKLNNKAMLNFYSVSFFGAYDWGKNEENLDTIINAIDNSLTI